MYEFMFLPFIANLQNELEKSRDKGLTIAFESLHPCGLEAQLSFLLLCYPVLLVN